jgi:hypothetical protein
MQKSSCGLACFALIVLGTGTDGAQDTVKVDFIMPYSGQFADKGPCPWEKGAAGTDGIKALRET